MNRLKQTLAALFITLASTVSAGCHATQERDDLTPQQLTLLDRLHELNLHLLTNEDAVKNIVTNFCNADPFSKDPMEHQRNWDIVLTVARHAPDRLISLSNQYEAAEAKYESDEYAIQRAAKYEMIHIKEALLATAISHGYHQIDGDYIKPQEPEIK